VADQAALHGLPAKIHGLGGELLEVRRGDPTTDREITRCSMNRSQGARQQRRGTGSRGSQGGSSSVGRATRSTGAPPPAGSCPADTTQVMNRPDLPRRPAPTQPGTAAKDKPDL
jgi:hypothetical protein